MQTGFKPTGVTAILGGAMQKVGSVLDKIPVIGGILGGVVGAIGKLIGSLFGTKTSIVGQGIYGGAQSLGGIMAGGFEGQYFTDVQKKKKFLGITTSTRYSTQYSEASGELERQFSLIFTGFYDAISAAAGPLGLSLDEVQARLDSFVVSIGKIDLKGLTGAQIQEKLAAVFGAAADNLARYAIAGLDQFQKVGEGYFETLIRVASSVEAVTGAMTMLGRSTNLTIAASMDLVELFGSVVVAVVLTAIANPIQRFSRFPRGASLALAISLVIGVMGGAGALFGKQVDQKGGRSARIIHQALAFRGRMRLILESRIL